MGSVKNMKAHFPPMPRLKGQGIGVYIEPTIGSGERFCVLLAVVFDENPDGRRYRIHQAIPDDKVACLFGDEAPGFSGLVDLGRDSLTDHLENGGSLTDWEPPVQSMMASRPRFVQENNETGALRALMIGFSSLADWNDIESD